MSLSGIADIFQINDFFYNFWKCANGDFTSSSKSKCSFLFHNINSEIKITFLYIIHVVNKHKEKSHI